ncbi:TonB-dependent receptor [Pluralibacter gergoviae]|nr:TonB-dependent receptor [Pluralibacter gergoviae]ELC3015371.1 TonB-dependent receptor [Pluralibacter gergoviae]ELC3020350.1 TonB-dependent receptor [Pluralibacter gergoviae]HDS1234944.1 TonB-dependent receptor [Pluralibacter gergoviae]HDS1240903.1 TonB-dependent receptor [Pluralibacter gergoviae]
MRCRCSPTFCSWTNLPPTRPCRSSYSDTDGTVKNRGFAIIRLRADYEVGHGFSVNASVNNLFDTRYYYSEGFIEEGRNVWTGVEYTF